ncbi:MAG: hypothetical protein FWD56_03285 [Bacteroidales bacterium]|nr:hypothetical protein [Bacteroidales bacterium]
MKRSILVSISALLLATCSVEQPLEKSPAGKLRLSVNVQNIATDMLTRSTVASEEGEDTISSLYLLFFTPDVRRNGVFIDYVEVEMPMPNGTMKMNVETEIDITGTSLNLNNPYNILAIANIADNIYIDDEVQEWMLELGGKTESQVMFESYAYIQERLPVSPDRLLMNGRFEKVAGRTQINLLLTRNQARLDVYNNVRTTHDLVSTSIWNSYPSSSIWGEGVTDWSLTFARVREHYGVDNRTNETGQNGADGNGPILDNIKGGLYVFENQVISPEKNDRLTTCLIIGLRERATGEVTYYRANVHQEGNMQLLKRNHAYSLTIRNVTGVGAPTEELAYIGQGNSLEYTVGSWNLDDNGLIVSDDYSILSIPTKRINIGRDASVSTFSIYTFTTLSDAAPLTIRSQTYTPNGNKIRATLDGNTLVITADALGIDETERRGVVALSFAGLETSISILQSGVADDYLRVHLPDGGIPIPPFQPYTGIFSGLIRVEASGPWTARLYMEGFSFNSMPFPNPKVTILRSTDAIDGDRFRVYTHSRNEETKPRNAFIVITLDKDPENFASVVRLSQLNAGAVKLMPDNQTTIIFDGAGSLKSIPGVSNVNQFTVDPGVGSDGILFNPWSAKIIQQPHSAYDDRLKFQILDRDNNPVPDDFSGLYHATNPLLNVVGAMAKGLNMSGREQIAVLRIYKDPTTFTDITLIQEATEWEIVTPGHVPIPAISAAGGTSINIGINAPAGLHFTATLQTLLPTTLTNHWGCLIDMANGNAKVSSLTNRDVSETFQVYFPKLIWPNIDVSPHIILAVTLVESGETKYAVITQNAIPQHQINIRQYATDWGQVMNSSSNWSSSFNDYFVTYLSSAAMFGPSSSYVKTFGGITRNQFSNTSSPGATPSTVRWFHLIRPVQRNQAISTVAHTWRQNNEGVLVINHEESSNNNFNSGWGSNYLPGRLYQPNSVTGGAGSGSSNNGTYYIWNQPANRIVKYLTEDAPWASGVANWFNVQLTTGGNTSYVNIASLTDPDIIPILRNSSGRTSLMIDPKRNVVLLCDSETFDNGTFGSAPNPSGAQGRFTANLLAYIVNAAQYGSYFTDYFWDSPRYLETAPTP